MSATAMAEPKKRKGKPGPKPDPKNTRVAAIMVRGRQDWKDWVDQFAGYMRSASVGDLVDKALVAYARQNGFERQAPPR